MCDVQIIESKQIKQKKIDCIARMYSVVHNIQIEKNDTSKSGVYVISYRGRQQRSVVREFTKKTLKS